MWDIIKSFFGNWRTWGIVTFLGSLLAGLWNTIVDFLNMLFQKAIGLISSLVAPEAVAINFEGLTAYFSQQFRFAECLTVIFSAYLLKFLLRKIPFIRW